MPRLTVAVSVVNWLAPLHSAPRRAAPHRQRDAADVVVLLGQAVRGDLAPRAEGAGRLPLRVKIGYALPAMAQFAFQIPVNVLSKKYYADVLLLKLDQLAVGLAAGCVLDGALDLVIGWFADRLRTPYGRRRPLIAIGAVAVAFALWNFLSPPNYASEWMLFVHFTTGFLLYHAAYALFNIPYISLGYELTEDYDERSQIFAGRELLGLLGLFCATALPSAIKMASPATDAVAAEQARNSFRPRAIRRAIRRAILRRAGVCRASAARDARRGPRARRRPRRPRRRARAHGPRGADDDAVGHAAAPRRVARAAQPPQPLAAAGVAVGQRGGVHGDGGAALLGAVRAATTPDGQRELWFLAVCGATYGAALVAIPFWSYVAEHEAGLARRRSKRRSCRGRASS